MKVYVELKNEKEDIVCVEYDGNITSKEQLTIELYNVLSNSRFIKICNDIFNTNEIVHIRILDY